MINICISYAVENKKTQDISTSYYLNAVTLYSDGNNAKEAKVKALNQAFLRSFLLTADRLGLMNNDLRNVPLKEIKVAIEKYEILNEKYENKIFSASLNIYFDPQKTYEIIKSHSNQEIIDKITKYIAIPLFKIGDKFIFTEQGKEFLDLWYKNEAKLNDSSIILPYMQDVKYISSLSPNANTDVIKESIYFKLLIPIMKKYFAWRPVIVLSEINTDFSTGKSYMEVCFVELLSDNFLMNQRQYILDDYTDVAGITENIIKDFTEKFGK